MTTLTSIPAAPKALPLLGHLAPMLRDPLAFLTSLPAHGDLLQIRVGRLKMIVVCDSELLRQVLRDDRTFDKGGPFYDRAREAVGDSLVTYRHDQHRPQRRLAQPAFHSARLPGYAQTMTSRIVNVMDTWQDGQIVHVPTEMMTITSRALVATMFSDTLSAPVADGLLDDVRAILDGILQRMLMLPPLDRLPTPGNRSYWRANSHLHHAIGGVIDQYHTGGADRGDLLSALLAVPDAESDGQGLTDTVVTFFLAGIETTATTLAWALHLLGQHPVIEQRLHAEVDDVLAGRPATYEDLPRLELTGRIITETLRMYPPAWFFTRVVTADAHLGGHPIPAGATVVFSPYLIHHRDDLYDQPESFDPDRWDSGLRPQPPRHAFVPFGGGARKCIGDTYGIVEATLALATIAARWRLEPVPGRRVHPTRGTILRPRDLRMRVTARTSAGR
ncbi:cytochrome P450 [Lentzea roselyniae]|uniref:Cytochrome P450 n=1 Tax=Lentzea roselyniae TaxID=531940 RepID=A0ABP7AWS1_9PSEU